MAMQYHDRMVSDNLPNNHHVFQALGMSIPLHDVFDCKCCNTESVPWGKLLKNRRQMRCSCRKMRRGYEGEEEGGDAEADAHHEGALEDGFDLVLEAQAHDADGNHRDEDVGRVASLVVPLELAEALQYPHHFLPEDDECGEDGGHVDDNVERQAAGEGIAVVEQQLANLQMAAGGDGQVFRQALHEAEDESLNVIHI